MAATLAPAIAPLPADIRLVNHVAALLFALAVIALVVVSGGALARLPVFSIQSVRIDGDIVRNSVTTIRANAMPKLAGSYFTLDLGTAKAAFESVPWVRRAVVSRVWPNRLEVRIEEHRAAALWGAVDGRERLVNSYGEVFDANLGDVEDEALPVLVGPDGAAARMLAMHARLAPLFGQAFDKHARIETLTLSGRGSWRVQLESGAEIELGRGSDDDVLARAERFVRTLPQATAQYPQRPLLYADLRHRHGYALRLRGVTTTAVPDEKKR